MKTKLKIKKNKESFLEYLKDLVVIFFEFLKIGSVSFGGGLAIGDILPPPQKTKSLGGGSMSHR